MGTLGKRINYFDVAKGTGILCVIAAHMGRETNNRIIHTFAMTLFFLISGYFLSTTKDFKTYRREKIKQLAPPYIFASVCLMVLTALINLFQGNIRVIPKEVLKWVLAAGYGAGVSYYEPFFIKQIGAIWFFLGVGWALLIVKYFAEKKYGGIIIAAIAYMGYATAQYFWLPFSIQAGALSSIFVYVGYLLRKEKFMDRPFHLGLFLLSVGMLVFEAIFNIRIYNVNCELEGGLLSVIGAVLICYSVIWVSKGIELKLHLLNKVLSFYGRNSMIILCLHVLELSLFPWPETYTYLNSVGIIDTPSVVVVYLIKLAYATLFTFVILKIPFLRKIFGK